MQYNFTQEELFKQIHYDPLTGVFTRISKPKGSRAQLGPIKGYRKEEGHLRLGVFGHQIYMAILAWFYMTGVWPTEIVDHKNGISDDNRWENLREVSKIGNLHNQTKAHHHNKSGLLGAHFDKKRNKYESSIWVNGKRIRLGRFNTAEEAHTAYVAAKRVHHSTCTL